MRTGAGGPRLHASRRGRRAARALGISGHDVGARAAAILAAYVRCACAAGLPALRREVGALRGLCADDVFPPRAARCCTAAADWTDSLDSQRNDGRRGPTPRGRELTPGCLLIEPGGTLSFP